MMIVGLAIIRTKAEKKAAGRPARLSLFGRRGGRIGPAHGMPR